MNVLWLLDRLCREIDASVAKLWWGNKNKDRGIHWLNWEEMDRAKGDGSMGFRNLNDFNSALLTKQCWRIIHEPESFWVKVLKDRYFPHELFLNTKRGGRAFNLAYWI